MGHYTSYQLEVETCGSDLISRDIIIDLLENNFEAACALEDDGSCADQTKWYEARDELKAFSKGYPGVLFVLSGEGEEAGDLWKSYFMDGKEQYVEAAITYAAFDKSKLK